MSLRTHEMRTFFKKCTGFRKALFRFIISPRAELSHRSGFRPLQQSESLVSDFQSRFFFWIRFLPQIPSISMSCSLRIFQSNLQIPLLDRWSLSPILRKFLSRRNFRVSLILRIVSSISRVLSFDFRRFADGRGRRSEILGLRGFDSSGRDVLAYGGAVHRFAGEFNLISSLCNFISFSFSFCSNSNFDF